MLIEAQTVAEPSQDGCVASSAPYPMGCDTSQRASVCMRRKPDARSETHVSPANRRSKASSKLWDTLEDGKKAVIRGREYVCLGWFPVPNKGGHSVAVRMWGACAACGAGFEFTTHRRGINEGYPPKLCPAHRRPVITRAGLRP